MADFDLQKLLQLRYSHQIVVVVVVAVEAGKIRNIFDGFCRKSLLYYLKKLSSICSAVAVFFTAGFAAVPYKLSYVI